MIVRVFADKDGKTHLETLEIPYGGEIEGVGFDDLRDIPTTTLGMTEMKGRRRSLGFHPAPRKQLVLVVRGEIEITASDGDSRRAHAGDVLFADDLDSEGHKFEDVGNDTLFTVQIGVETGWQWPGQTVV